MWILSTKTDTPSDIEIARLVDRLMRRLHLALNARAAEFDRERLGPANGMLLLTLADIEPAPTHQLVEMMARDKSQMSRALQMLERRGLIRRDADPCDGRVTILQLTDHGHSIVGELQEAVAGVLGTLMADFSAQDRHAFRNLLGKF